MPKITEVGRGVDKDGREVEGAVTVLDGSRGVECDHGIRLTRECGECEAVYLNAPDDIDDDEDGNIERHSLGCVCADCSGGELTADND